MSFIKKTVPPPDVKEGDVLIAKILDVQYPIEGKYNPQIKWQVQLENGYEATVWMTYYDEPRDKSVLGQLCITYMNTQQKSFDKVGEVLEALKSFGKIYVKCSGFREWNENLYPKFKVVSSKLPMVQKKTAESPLVT